MKIAVVGARGTLGSALRKYWNSAAVREKSLMLADAADDELMPLDLPEFDVTSRRFTLDTLSEIAPNVIINASGVHFFDWVEAHPNTARTVHVQGAANLREAARRTGALLVHLGCAEIFSPETADSSAQNGDGGESNAVSLPPWREEDAPNPLSILAKTKLDAERAVAEAPRFLIVRTSTLFGDLGEQSAGNLADTILKSSRRTESLKVIRDIRVSPTYTLDLVRALRCLVQTGATGVYHVANAQTATLAEFASHLLKTCGLSRHKIVGITSSEYGGAAPRSTDTTLDTSKYRRLPDACTLPDWHEAVREFIARRQEGGVGEN